MFFGLNVASTSAFQNNQCPKIQTFGHKRFTGHCDLSLHFDSHVDECPVINVLSTYEVNPLIFRSVTLYIRCKPQLN